MAQTQRQPVFPPPTFLGRPEYLAVSGPRLPPLHTPPQSVRLEQHAPVLPPLQMTPYTTSPQHERPSRAIPVSQLLSSAPASPRRQRPSIPTPQLPTLSPSSFAGSPTDIRARPPASAYPPAYHQQALASHPFSRQAEAGESRRFEGVGAPPYGPAETAQVRYDIRQDSAYQKFERHAPPESVYSDPTPGSRPAFSPAPTAHSSAHSVYDNAYSEPDPETEPFRRSSAPIVRPPPLNYNLTMRQQPQAARACGFGERDRRVIDPPPILELKIVDPKTGAPEQDLNALLALHCTLLSEDGREDETEVPAAHPDLPSTRRLMGTLVASPYQAKDENGVAGTFFVFPDLSCRSPGRYRLHFKLIRVDPTQMMLGTVHASVSQIVTEKFDVFTAKDFPGMKASTPLLKSLRRQGLNVGVKKGSDDRKKKARAKQESDSDEDDSVEDDAGDEGPAHPMAQSSEAAKSKQSKVKNRRKRRET